MRNNLTYIQVILVFLTLVTLISCEEERFEAFDLKNADFTTLIDEPQTITYFFDDGKRVGDALSLPVLSIKSDAKTYTQEQLLKLRMNSLYFGLPDSLVPFSYLFSTNYSIPLQKNVSLEIYYNYPYDNDANNNSIERDFLLSNIEKLKLYRLTRDTEAENYSNPPKTISDVQFSLDKNNNSFVFDTDNLKDEYLIAYPNTERSDSLSIILEGAETTAEHNLTTSGFVEMTYGDTQSGGYMLRNELRYRLLTREGSNLVLNSNKSHKIYNLEMVVRNPSLGLVNIQDIGLSFQLEALPVREGYAAVTSLIPVSQTNIEILELGDIGESVRLRMYGKIFVQSEQKLANIDFSIKFIRLR